MSFSKGLTLWGSNKVVKKWLRYRKAAMEDMSPENSLLLLEDIIYEIRKDVGQRKRLGKCYDMEYISNIKEEEVI